MFWCEVVGTKHEVRTVLLKEPKRVKAVESSQSGDTRQLSFGQTAWRPCAPTGARKLLMMKKYATALIP